MRYGRHNKIHLFLSIHDPKQEIAKIELGDIRVKMVFQTVNSRKSSNALGSGGAEKLNGSGEMIFDHISTSYQLQGFYIDDDKIDLEIQNSRQGFLDTDIAYENRFIISDGDLKNKEAEIDGSIMKLSLVEINSVSENEHGDKLAEIVLWALSQKSVSVNFIQEAHSVGNKYAKKYYQRLQSWGIIGDIIERGRREVIPQSIEELPDDLKAFLSNYGITDNKIMEAIDKRVKL